MARAPRVRACVWRVSAAPARSMCPTTAVPCRRRHECRPLQAFSTSPARGLWALLPLARSRRAPASLARASVSPQGVSAAAVTRSVQRAACGARREAFAPSRRCLPLGGLRTACVRAAWGCRARWGTITTRGCAPRLPRGGGGARAARAQAPTPATVQSPAWSTSRPSRPPRTVPHRSPRIGCVREAPVNTSPASLRGAAPRRGAVRADDSLLSDARPRRLRRAPPARLPAPPRLPQGGRRHHERRSGSNKRLRENMCHQVRRAARTCSPPPQGGRCQCPRQQPAARDTCERCGSRRTHRFRMDPDRSSAPCDAWQAARASKAASPRLTIASIGGAPLLSPRLAGPGRADRRRGATRRGA